MFANHGFFLILLGFIVTLYGFFASILSAYWRHRRLYLSSKFAMTAACAIAVLSSALVVYSLFQRDYALAYVAKNSSNDLP
ncbi:MAG: hypothetical protein V4655_12750, partial [Bdellovibrionota bacterium]